MDFYLLMLGIPLAGWLALAPWGADRLDADTITFFSLLPLNVWPDLGHWTSEMHEIGGTLAKLLIAIHVLAAPATPVHRQGWTDAPHDVPLSKSATRLRKVRSRSSFLY